MKKILLVLASLGFSIQSFADTCHSQSITVGSKKVEMFTIEDTPDNITGAKSKVIVSGIYKFVRKGEKWDVYRCAKANTSPPVYDANQCQIKNDFQFGSFVAKDKNGNNLQKVSDRGSATLAIIYPNAVDTNEYHVSFKKDAVEVVEYDYQNRQMAPKTIATCDYMAKSQQSSGKKGSSGSPAQKVGISN